ncbi:MAG: hypothetical protein NWR15_07500, partial [Limnohabitans sp.]|nr:hypothetical protein [Limnohabitans sp.]MDP4923341.1 hypothetical protein [Limnohabitans sp.]
MDLTETKSSDQQLVGRDRKLKVSRHFTWQVGTHHPPNRSGLDASIFDGTWDRPFRHQFKADCSLAFVRARDSA